MNRAYCGTLLLILLLSGCASPGRQQPPTIAPLPAPKLGVHMSFPGARFMEFTGSKVSALVADRIELRDGDDRLLKILYDQERDGPQHPSVLAQMFEEFSQNMNEE